MKTTIYYKNNLIVSGVSLLITLVSPIFSNLTFQDAQYSTIHYHTNGGTPISQRTYKVGDIIDIPDTSREGFTFVDWYSENSFDKPFNLTIMPAWDIKIYAKWDANLYTISFETNGGNTIPSIQGYFGDPISPSINPTREGYTFNGWFANASLTQSTSIPTTIPSQNITVYAKWTINQYTITFETNGGNSVPTQTKNYNSSLALPTPAKVGHSFGGWFTDVRLTQPFNLTNMPASDVTLYAKWTINQYTITFNTNGGSSIDPVTGNYGDSVTAPSNPTREGYTFNGWFANASLTQSTTVPTTIPSQNQTLYAKWTINQYTITFNTNGGNSIQTQTKNFNTSLSIPTPTKVGYSFAGWFTDVGSTQAFTLTNMPAQNLTLHAKWTINQYTITFETNGGSSIASITGNFGDPVTAPSNPTRLEALFIGWYSDANLTQSANIPTTIPTENLTLYAKWTINQYTITFETNGGSSIAPITGNYGDLVSEPINPIKEGHLFQGWFEDAALTIPTSLPNSIPSSNLYYFAKWSILKFTIIWKNYDGVILETDIEVDYGTIPTFNTSSPSRSKRYDFAGYWFIYTFEGWDPIISPVIGDQIYTAKFNSSYTFCGSTGWLC